jgi:hypothetical protein
MRKRMATRSVPGSFRTEAGGVCRGREVNPFPGRASECLGVPYLKTSMVAVWLI